MLRRSLRAIEPWLTDGVPVVGLEPSCTAALRADGAELLPADPLASALAGGVRTFAELLAEHADELRSRRRSGTSKALVQLHCHQHAELGIEADRAVMAALGIDAEVLDSGCCGLAGNFGFEKGHYEVSMACAERVLLPAVRAAAPDVEVLADGFSCRTQLRQAGTPRTGPPGPAGGAGAGVRSRTTSHTQCGRHTHCSMCDDHTRCVTSPGSSRAGRCRACRRPGTPRAADPPPAPRRARPRRGPGGE